MGLALVKWLTDEIMARLAGGLCRGFVACLHCSRCGVFAIVLAVFIAFAFRNVVSAPGFRFVIGAVGRCRIVWFVSLRMFLWTMQRLALTEVVASSRSRSCRAVRSSEQPWIAGTASRRYRIALFHCSTGQPWIAITSHRLACPISFIAVDLDKI